MVSVDKRSSTPFSPPRRLTIQTDSRVAPSRPRRDVICCAGVINEQRGSQSLQFNQIKLTLGATVLEIAVQRVHFENIRCQWLPSENHRPIYKLPRPR